MEKISVYYRGKLVDLFNQMFIEIGDVRNRFIMCENKFIKAYEASMDDGVPKYVKEYWVKMWNDLNTK